MRHFLHSRLRNSDRALMNGGEVTEMGEKGKRWALLREGESVI